MARIPEAELERLKDEIAVERLAEARGVALTRKGADLVGLCPFHDDREPSLVITPAKNLWHCLGACQAGGSVVDWVMRAEGVSFRHAVELLQADYEPSASAPAVKRSTVQKLPTPLARGADDVRLLRQVIDYYHETLLQAPEAQAYLAKRGIASREAVARFRLGYANRTLGYRLPAKTRQEGAAIRGQLQRIGILRPSGHEHFNGSLVIPVFGEKGEVTEVYGRKIQDHLREGTPLHLYLPGPHQGVWNVEALVASKEIILCESLIDALSFWCAGYRNVTASYGVEGFTADHLAAFQAHGTERVLLAYDRDAAGEAAAEKLAKQLLEHGIGCYRVQLPKGMDANEYAAKVQPATKSLGVLIRTAQWLGKGKPRPVTTEAVASESTTPAIATASEPPPSVRDADEEAAPPLAALAAPAMAAKVEALAAIEAPLPAAVIPDSPRAALAAEVTEHEITIALGDRRYRIRGLEKNASFDALKVNLLVSRPAFDGSGEALHVDTFDLYAQRPRAAFAKQAAVELGVQEDVVKADLGKILLKLEALQTERIENEQAAKEQRVSLSDDETEAALALLRAPDLLTRIERDFTRCGVVGEATNKLVGYLAAISRKLEAPLAVTIQSTSAAGKSSLLDAVLAFVPEEDRVKYSAMTGQSLFYLGETDLQHKVLALVEEEGASHAAYALKLLQSEGELTIASTGKDPVTGELRTRDYRVRGPVMILFTTTAIDVDEELLNRCLVLTVDEGRAQTRAIHALQRERRTLPGLLAKAEKQSVVALHQNAQRLLEPLAVVNPFSRQLTFVDDRTRTRRDHEKYLTLIDAIALLHQHQRKVQTVLHHGEPIRYVEVTREDIATANRLAHEVLGRTLDELAPKTRDLLRRLAAWVAERCTALGMAQSDFRFSRRAVREALLWSDTALKVHLGRLAEMEYVLVHRGGRGQSFEYELVYRGEGEEGQPFLMGLLDPTTLDYDAERSGLEEDRSGAGQAAVGGQSAGGPDAEGERSACGDGTLEAIDERESQNALLRPARRSASYRTHSAALGVRVG